jgi:hypothetical protein
MTRAPSPCYLCARFTITGHDEAAASGQGWCDGDERYIPWDWQPCVLFNRGRDEARRRSWAARHETTSRASA